MERDVGNESLQAACLNNIGAVYFEKCQYEDARTYYQQALQLREKSNVPGDIVETVSKTWPMFPSVWASTIRPLRSTCALWNCTATWMTQMAQPLIPIPWASCSITRGGSAPPLTQNATPQDPAGPERQNYHDDPVEGGYGESLVLAGRSEEAKTDLDDALKLAHEQKNDGLVSQTLGFQGDAAYYRSDAKSARVLYEQSLQAAIRSKEPDRTLIAKVNLAKVRLQEGQARQSIASLRQLMQQADEQGVQNISVECSIYMAEAMLQNHDNAGAQQELRRALVRADKIGLKPLSAKANFLLGAALRTSGNQAEAQQHDRTTVQLLDDMRKEPGADKILQRSDFKTMYDEATRGSQAAKS